MKKFFSLMRSVVFMLILMNSSAFAIDEASVQTFVPEYKFGPMPKRHIKLISWYIDKYEDDVISYEIEKKAPVKYISQRTGLFSKKPAYGWASLVKVKKHNYKHEVIGHHLRKGKNGSTYYEKIESYPIKSGFKIKTYRIYVRNYSVVAKEVVD